MFRTESQQKEICRGCPMAKAANLIGDSVVLVIIRELFTGTKRFGDIAEALPEVSSRTITEKLKQMESDKIISRAEFAEKPPRVEYSLTAKGKGLEQIVEALFAYGRKFL